MDWLADVAAQLPTTPQGWVRYLLWFFLIWAIVSVPAAAFHKIVGAALNALGKRAEGALKFLWSRVRKPLDAVRDAVDQSSRGMRHVTLVRLDNLKSAVRRVGSAIKQERKRLQAAAQRLGVERRDVARQLKAIDADVAKLKQLPDAIEIDDPAENRARLASAWLGAIVTTPIALGLLGLNTLMLDLFFREMFDLRIVLFNYVLPIAFILALLYTLVEMALGFILERINVAAGQSANRLNYVVPQIFVLILIGLAVAFEWVLYSMLSYEMEITLPEAMAGMLPEGLREGWFGIFGLILAGAIAAFGYWVGHLWHEVVHYSQYPSLKRQARLLNKELAALPNRMQQVAAAAASAQQGVTPEEAARLPAPLQLSAQVAEIDANLRQLTNLENDTRVPHAVEGPSDEQRRHVWVGLMTALVGIAAFAGAGATMSLMLAGSGLLLRLSIYAPLILGWLLALCAVFSGFALTFANEVGHAGANGVRWHPTAWERGVWVRIAGAVLLLGVAAVGCFLIYDLAGWNFALMIAFSVIALVSASVGYFLPLIGEGLRFTIDFIVSTILTVIALVAGIVLGVIGYVLQALYWFVHWLAAPSLLAWALLKRLFERRSQTAPAGRPA